MNTILETAELVRTGALSPVELTQECLARIKQLNPALNAFITVTGDSALQEARQAENEIRHGTWRGPLHGIPLSLKDLIDTAGTRTTAASALFKDRVPQEDAEVVRRLRAAGAVLLGKQNLHEFAYGASSIVSYFGEVRNPWSLGHIAGGSSGGSAAAVAAGLCYAAVGTDTAGSIREPAAICGVVGFKPTYGRVSSRGVVPLSVSLDHVGPITATVADAAIMLQVIAGYDARDPSSADRPVDNYHALMRDEATAIRIGVPRAFFYEDIDPEIASAIKEALNVLGTIGFDIHDVDVPVSTDRTLQSAESYAYHAESVARNPQLYQAETLRRILSGAHLSPSDYFDRRRELEEIRCSIASVFKNIDGLVTPTTPVLPPTITELKNNPDKLRPCEILLLRNTRPVNVWGLPAISLPGGFSNSGLPIGLQIIGPHWGEGVVLRIARAYEQATAWHKRRPKLEGPQVPS